MKKILILVIALAVGTVSANAQFGNIIRKAAQKATEKAVDKAVDHAEKNAEKAMDRGLEEADKAIDRGLDNAYGKNRDNTANRSTSQQGDQDVTYASLIQQALDMPTAEQFVNHKSYEFNEQSFKLLTSPVTRYLTNVAMLAAQAAGLAYSNMDSAQVVDAAYNIASSYSGLSRDEIEMLSTMSETEQEAYLKAHYASGTAEAAAMKEAFDAAKYLEPLQPTIDRWNNAGEKADNFIKAADDQCRNIYAKYSGKIASAGSDKAKNEILLKYYSETAPIQREAALKAMQTRLKEQLPIAEQIEKEMAKIRSIHKDYISQLLNYPQLTVTQCIGDATQVSEIKDF